MHVDSDGYGSSCGLVVWIAVGILPADISSSATMAHILYVLNAVGCITMVTYNIWCLTLFNKE